MSGTARPHATCPRCGYDLAGEISRWETQCPLQGLCSECGLECAWRDVLSPRYRLHEPHIELDMLGLFRGFIASAALAFTPRRLWKRLTLETPIAPDRLLILLVGTIIGGAALWATIGFTIYFIGTLRQGADIVSAAAWGRWLLVERVTQLGRNPVLLSAALLSLWSVGVLLLARSAHHSFQSAKFRTLHILRIESYATIPVMALLIVETHAYDALALFGLTFWPGSAGFQLLQWLWWYVTPAALILWHAAFLWLAFTRYLRLPRPRTLLLLNGVFAGVPVAALLGMMFFRGWENGWVL